MILIRKKREPRALQQYRNMIGASYQNMHGAPTGRKRENGEPEDLYEVVLEHLRKRFDDGLIDLMLRFKWWDKSIEEIDRLIPILTSSDLEKVRKDLQERL